MMVASMPFYPVFLNLEGRRVAIVGGGPVAVRKARGVLEAGAQVTLISPELSTKLRVEWKRRRYRQGDLEGAALVFAATDDRAVNAKVGRDATALGIPVNVADAPGECAFIVPARIRKNGFHLAISTDGRDPRRTAALRKKLESSELLG